MMRRGEGGGEEGEEEMMCFREEDGKTQGERRKTGQEYRQEEIEKDGR